MSEGPWAERLRGLVRVEVELQREGDEDDELREDGRDDLVEGEGGGYIGWGLGLGLGSDRRLVVRVKVEW